MSSYLQKDDFISSEECEILINCWKSEIKETPNVNLEFSNRIVYFKDVQNINAKSLMSEIKYRVLYEIRKYFNVKTIYPDSAHLVVWRPGTKLGWHADNATYPNRKPNWSSHRTWSAVLYLNDDYEGGEFVFLKNSDGDINDEENHLIIKPKRGMMICFSAGLDSVHSVKEVKNGNRYTLPLWYTDQELSCEL